MRSACFTMLVSSTSSSASTPEAKEAGGGGLTRIWRTQGVIALFERCNLDT